MRTATQKLIVEFPDGTFRDATPQEIEAAKRVKQRRDKLTAQIGELQKELDRAECDHKVCYDEHGAVYNNRVCFGCGKFMGSF